MGRERDKQSVVLLVIVENTCPCKFRVTVYIMGYYIQLVTNSFCRFNGPVTYCGL